MRSHSPESNRAALMRSRARKQRNLATRPERTREEIALEALSKDRLCKEAWRRVFSTREEAHIYRPVYYRRVPII